MVHSNDFGSMIDYCGEIVREDVEQNTADVCDCAEKYLVVVLYELRSSE